MNHLQRLLTAMAVLLLVVVGACSNKAGDGEHQEGTAHLTEERGERDRDGREHDGEGGEHGREG